MYTFYLRTVNTWSTLAHFPPTSRTPMLPIPTDNEEASREEGGAHSKKDNENSWYTDKKHKKQGELLSSSLGGTFCCLPSGPGRQLAAYLILVPIIFLIALFSIRLNFVNNLKIFLKKGKI